MRVIDEGVIEFLHYFSEWRHLRILMGTSLCWFLLDIAYVFLLPSSLTPLALFSYTHTPQLLRHKPKPKRRPPTNRLRRVLRHTLEPPLQNLHREHHHHRPRLRTRILRYSPHGGEVG